MPFILLVIPNLYLWAHAEYHTPFLLGACCLIFLYTLLKTTKYSFILLPFLWLIPFYLYYIALYKTFISEQVLSIVLETNVQEAWHFIGSSVYLYISAWLIWCVSCSYLCYQHYKYPKIWQHRSRYWIFIILMFYFSSSYLVQQQLSDTINENFVDQDNFLVDEKNAFIQELKQTYPVGLFITFYDLWAEQKKIQQAFSLNNKFNFQAKQITPIYERQKEVYVLVIGETSRRENWQLNGYLRKTNPRLSQQTNIVNFSYFLSVSTETRTAMPMMLTRKPAERVYSFNFNEKSVISAFKEAGFKTYWLSTQQRFGAFDTSTSVYAKEADQLMFLNNADYKHAGELDSILVPALARITQRNEQKQFIVLHTLGSHYNYVHRYPEQFNQFQPSLNKRESYSLQNSKFKKELLNSYDNSILFTDFVLNNIIETLKKQNIQAFILYSSDHGEDLFDEGCQQSGHGLNTAHNLEIASFVWYSDKYAERNPKKIVQLQTNQARKINQTAIFPTLLHAANISIKDDSLEKSFLKKFNDYPRLVLGGKNYDTKQKEGICQEIP